MSKKSNGNGHTEEFEQNEVEQSGEDQAVEAGEKQLLFYDRVVPVNSERHRDWAVTVGTNYDFAQTVNSIPLTAVEFGEAATCYPIVFVGKDENVMPAAIMGIQADKNLFINEAGELEGAYAPAFLRRYPFVFSTNDEGDRLTLCLDEGYKGFNEEGRGERLFDAEGEQTQYLKGTLSFLSRFQAHFNRTQVFCKKLQELELLEPMGVQFNLGDGQPRALSGFMAIQRTKLAELSGDQLQELFRTGELELAYIHLQSLHNLGVMARKLGDDLAA